MGMSFLEFSLCFYRVYNIKNQLLSACWVVSIICKSLFLPKQMHVSNIFSFSTILFDLRTVYIKT
uniref:Uncharacterized protein n=1 Tax=Oryza brachyantha TaxID=4533 RepID=J3LQT3_ORYBR